MMQTPVDPQNAQAVAAELWTWINSAPSLYVVAGAYWLKHYATEIRKDLDWSKRQVTHIMRQLGIDPDRD